MSNRHLARTIALQTLYQWDFHGCDNTRLEEWKEYTRQEFAPKFEDDGFISDLVKGVVEHVTELDALVTTFAPEWPLATMTVVDRNVLRLGAYELRYEDRVPSKVAINEAIELAKGFGGEASGRFVNGVLGAIYKDMVAKGLEKAVDKEPTKPKKSASPASAEEPTKPEQPSTMT